MGSALSHLVAQSLLLQAAKVLTKGQEKFADLQTALNLTESLYAQNNKRVGELGLELNELKASADKEITHWQNVAGEAQKQLAPVTKERDELLRLCREIREWLKPEVIKEPDRTFFWKLVAAIQKCDNAIAPGLSLAVNEICETCKGRKFYTLHLPDGSDADDQPCPDCNPNGDSRDAP